MLCSFTTFSCNTCPPNHQPSLNQYLPPHPTLGHWVLSSQPMPQPTPNVPKPPTALSLGPQKLPPPHLHLAYNGTRLISVPPTSGGSLLLFLGPIFSYLQDFVLSTIPSVSSLSSTLPSLLSPAQPVHESTFLPSLMKSAQGTCVEMTPK